MMLQTDHGPSRAVQPTYNGMPATSLHGARWLKSRRSNSQGNCVEMAELPDDRIAMRNSRHPEGPALIYTRPEIEALILGAKDGDFDHLLGAGN
ncbi:DUF397 domain-containing protein [Actinomadura parmotrematis]|uniref:DUF397 domain-containing protein n=1 Tax=Actinomadura parmotrematis TaxID=2864039 RepID=A0ABS7FZF1_9ACTN|nr:DUF397 domain-containing protein [Actinomadura parmotrematis]MBW8485827.1 DUF397 domain-containing protein [Actinomadura parmotrematis]